MIRGPETKNAIERIHPGRSVLARLCRLGIASAVVTTGLLNVGTVGLLTVVATTGLVTMIFVRVTSGGLPVVVALVKVTSIVGLLVVLVLVRVLVRVVSPGLPIVMGGGGGPLQISPTGQQPPPRQQTVL
jgi:hypothetical protein